MPAGSPHLYGFGTLVDQNSERIILYLAYFGPDGPDINTFDPVRLWRGDAKDPSTIIQAKRLKIVSDAVCRYLNCGGEMLEAEDLVKNITDTHNEIFISNPEQTLIDVEESDVDYSLIYKCPNEKYLHTVQGKFTEVLSNIDLIELLSGHKSVFDRHDDDYLPFGASCDYLNNPSNDYGDDWWDAEYRRYQEYYGDDDTDLEPTTTPIKSYQPVFHNKVESPGALI